MNIFSLLSTHKKLIINLGFRQYIKYAVSKRFSEVRLIISDHEIYVRKGTPDILVALLSLNEEFESLRYLLPKNFRGLIIDAGAYIGTASISLHKLFPCSKIIAIEPSSDNLKVLKKNLVGHENIEIIQAALTSESNEFISLKNRFTGNWGFTVVNKPADNPDAEILEEVRTITLEDILKSNNANEIGILKIDIEGGELDLLENSKKDLEKSNIVIAELHERIAPTVTKKFLEFSKGRVLIKNPFEEKYLSIKKS